MADTFTIVLTGDVLPGHQAENVAVALAKLLKTTEEKAAALLLGRETVVKRNVAPGEVDRYLRALGHAGAAVLHRPTSAAPPAAVTPTQAPQMTSAGVAAPETRLQAAPRESLAAPAAPGPAVSELAIVETVICPGCGHSQPKRTLCLQCSCDMPRMRAAKEKEAMAPQAPPEPAYWASPRANVEDVDDEESETPAVFAMSMAGRIGCLRYLAYVWPAVAPAAIGGILAALLMPRSMVLGVVLLVPVMLVVFWMTLRLMVMRLHDVNRTGKWVLLMFVLSAIAGVAQSPVLMTVGSAIFWILSLALMLWPGTDGGNDYGGPPGPNTTWVKVGAFALIAFQVIGTIGAVAAMRSAKNGALEAWQRSGAASRTGEIRDPVFAEIRIEQEVGGRQIEMAYFGKMNGESDCQEQAGRIEQRMLSNCRNCIAKTTACRSQLQPRHAALFDNEPSSLTYLSLARGDSSEREGRLMFWGLSVPESNMICDSLVGPMQQSQKGRVQCIRAGGS